MPASAPTSRAAETFETTRWMRGPPIAEPWRHWLPSCLHTIAVDCWIGVVQEADRRVVRLAGRLTVAQVPELHGACADARTVQIDLTDLVSADPPGIEALQRLRSQGATLVGTPGYIQMKLDSPADVPAIPPASRPRR